MKNKILPILCICILFSFLLVGNVFATNYDLSDYKNHVSGKNWVIIYIVAKDEFQLITTDLPYLYGNSLHLVDDGYDWIDSTILCSHSLTTNPWGDSGNYVQIYNFNNSTNTFSYSSQTRFYDITEAYVIASNCTVYNATNHSIFFQQTPVPSMVVVPWEAPTVTLAQVLEKNNPMESFQTMMSGIIPYLIVFLVGLVAFWKAWQLLLKELRKA